MNENVLSGTLNPNKQIIEISIPYQLWMFRFYRSILLNCIVSIFLVRLNFCYLHYLSAVKCLKYYRHGGKYQLNYAFGKEKKEKKSVNG